LQRERGRSEIDARGHMQFIGESKRRRKSGSDKTRSFAFLAGIRKFEVCIYAALSRKWVVVVHLDVQVIIYLICVALGVSRTVKRVHKVVRSCSLLGFYCHWFPTVAILNSLATVLRGSCSSSDGLNCMIHRSAD
jgi:hypothetical protein